VQSGRGLGVGVMADPAVLERLAELVGFGVVPGTLNVRLAQPVEGGPEWQYLASADIAPDWEGRTGRWTV